MVLEFLVGLEALEDVVTSFEIFERTEHCTFKVRHSSMVLAFSV
jgi:hypothetical protein